MRQTIARPKDAMPATHLDLIGHWHIAAPVETVWAALADLPRWRHWWPGVDQVRTLRPCQPDGAGGLCRIQSALGWPFRIALDIETLGATTGEQLRLRSRGALQGDAIWLLRRDGAATAITCVWRVEWPSRRARGLALFSSPMLRWRHRRLMASGEAGLRRHLATAATGSASRPGPGRSG